MKRKKSNRRIVFILFANNLINFLLGISIAFCMQNTDNNGAMLLFPLMILFVAFGWIWRGLSENSKN